MNNSKQGGSPLVRNGLISPEDKQAMDDIGISPTVRIIGRRQKLMDEISRLNDLICEMDKEAEILTHQRDFLNMRVNRLVEKYEEKGRHD